MPFDFDEIRRLLVTIAQTDIAEVTLKSNDFELTVRKSIRSGSNQMLPAFDRTLLDGESTGLTQNSDPTIGVGTGPSLEMDRNRVVDETSSIQERSRPPQVDSRSVEVISPMVGTFYQAPAPGEPSFVEVGDRIRLGQTVCIIEAMKLMNEIESEVSGLVLEVLLQNGEPVEFGQPLMRVKPD